MYPARYPPPRSDQGELRRFLFLTCPRTVARTSHTKEKNVESARSASTALVVELWNGPPASVREANSLDAVRAGCDTTSVPPGMTSNSANRARPSSHGA